jgi:hypothetical protein
MIGSDDTILLFTLARQVMFLKRKTKMQLMANQGHRNMY